MMKKESSKPKRVTGLQKRRQPKPTKSVESSVTDITNVKAEEALRESERRYRTVADFTYDWEYWLNPQGQFHYVSPSVERITGRQVRAGTRADELFQQIVHPEDLQRCLKHLQEEMARHESGEMEFRVIRLDGEVRWVHHICQSVYDEEGRYLGKRASNRDITERKQAADELSKYRERLEIMVNERTAELEKERASLEELNTALKVLLRQREQDKDDLEKNILANVKKLAMPYIQRLKKMPLNRKEADYVNILESNLMNIISPFSNKLSSKYLNFTSKEVQVAYLIREGLATKKIAESLKVSQGTIKFHRENIRSKLDLKNKKINLKSCLLTLS